MVAFINKTLKLYVKVVLAKKRLCSYTASSQQTNHLFIHPLIPTQILFYNVQVEHVIAPPLNSTETSMEDPTNVVNANQVFMVCSIQCIRTYCGRSRGYEGAGEVEDMKVLVSDLKEEVSEMRSDMVGLAKQLDYSQHMLQMSAKGSSTGCCSIL